MIAGSKSLDWSTLLQSGNRIFIGSNAAVPNALIDDLIQNAKQLHDIEIEPFFKDRDYRGIFRVLE